MLADVGHRQPAREREVLLRAIKSPVFARAWQAHTNRETTKIQLNGLP